jgi:hypothetical protein
MTMKSLAMTMKRQLDEIDTTLARIAHLAGGLTADPDRHVQRSVEELRTAFTERTAIEPAVGRVRSTVTLLRTEDGESPRREFHRRAAGLDHLGDVVEHELVPSLRRLGFEV